MCISDKEKVLELEREIGRITSSEERLTEEERERVKFLHKQIDKIEGREELPSLSKEEIEEQCKLVGEILKDIRSNMITKEA